jgi:hypothetical protein
METIIVGLIVVAAGGYLVWRGYNAMGKNSGCASGGCAGCGGCGCGEPPATKGH